MLAGVEAEERRPLEEGIERVSDPTRPTPDAPRGTSGTAAPPRPDPDPAEALETLRAIRTFLEAGDDHASGTRLPAASAFLAGSLAAIGAVVLETDLLPLPEPRAFLVVWGAVFGLAFVGSFALAEVGARIRGLPVLSILARRMTLALLPALLGAGVASVAILASGSISALPPVWMAFYATGLLAAAGPSWRPLSLVAAAFLSAAAAAALAAEDGRNIVMGVAFGGIHLAYAVSLYLRRSDPWDEHDRLAGQ